MWRLTPWTTTRPIAGDIEFLAEPDGTMAVLTTTMRLDFEFDGEPAVAFHVLVPIDDTACDILLLTTPGTEQADAAMLDTSLATFEKLD